MNDKPVSSRVPAIPAENRAGRNDPIGGPATQDDSDLSCIADGAATRSQRVSPRTTPSCAMVVNAGRSYVIARSIRDISLGGAWVELDTADLERGSTIELGVEFNDGRRKFDLQLSAEVVRTDAGGVALRFCPYDDRTYTDLVNLLYSR